MKQTDIRSHRRFLKASSILGAAAALNPAALRSAFANSNITPEEESMTATIAVPDSSTLETHNGAISSVSKRPEVLGLWREFVLRLSSTPVTSGRVGGPDGAAARMNIKRTTLISRMKKLGIDRARDREPVSGGPF